MSMTAIKERPIPFSSPMVNAIREKRKWMTRRLVKLRDFGPSDTPGYDWCFRRKGGCWEEYATADLVAKHCPCGRVGDRLWVRETWALVKNYGEDGLDDWDEPVPRERPWLPSAQVWYRAGHPWETDSVEDRGFRWRSPRFIPRWASRFLLEIEGVRVERLNDISPQDAWAEGVRCSCMSPVPQCAGNIEAFRELWESLHGRGSWAANPWLWVITFRRISK